MNWLELKVRMATEQRRPELVSAELNHPARGPHDENSGDTLSGLDGDTIDSVDAAVRMFARQGQWPQLSENERWLLLRRLRLGELLAGLLGGSREISVPQVRFLSIPEVEDEESAIEWLLNETWAAVGCIHYPEAWADYESTLLSPADDSS